MLNNLKDILTEDAKYLYADKLKSLPETLKIPEDDKLEAVENMLVINAVETKFLVPNMSMQQLEDFPQVQKMLVNLFNDYFVNQKVPQDVWWDKLRPGIMDSDGMIY